MITIVLKLFSGLPEEIGLKDYDLARGLERSVAEGARLKSVLRELGLKKPSACVFFLDGRRIDPGHRLRQGDVVTCVRPAGGG